MILKTWKKTSKDCSLSDGNKLNKTKLHLSILETLKNLHAKRGPDKDVKLCGSLVGNKGQALRI